MPNPPPKATLALRPASVRPPVERVKAGAPTKVLRSSRSAVQLSLFERPTAHR